jgi:Zn-dependent peptidase ImmA (M78 family)
MTTLAAPTPNPVIIAWARQDSGYTPERVAKRLQVTSAKVLAWEQPQGAHHPTLKQVEKLAAFFRRPLSLFFQDAPPQVPPLAAEYRRLPGVRPGAESPALRLALRQMSNRRERAIELSEELGVVPPALPLRASLRESPAEVAARIRAAIAIPDADQLSWRDGWLAWREWRTAVEDHGVLVFQFPGVDVQEVRGLSLLHQQMPVIGINSKEIIPEARIFTLIHELVHLALAAAGEEAPALRDQHDANAWTALERFVESVASQVIVPPAVLAQLVGNTTTFDLPAIRQLARRVRLTPSAIATRLWLDGRMSGDAYQAWRMVWDRWIAEHPTRGGGFSLPDQKALGRSGRPFVRLVFDALAQNRITVTDAARYLELRYQHFQKLTERLIGPIDLGTGDA